MIFRARPPSNEKKGGLTCVSKPFFEQQDKRLQSPPRKVFHKRH